MEGKGLLPDGGATVLKALPFPSPASPTSKTAGCADRGAVGRELFYPQWPVCEGEIAAICYTADHRGFLVMTAQHGMT